MNGKTSAVGTEETMLTNLTDLPRRVTGEMNNFLDHKFMEEDVSNALTHMFPTKALGPDGLPAAFFQRHWSSVKE